MRAHEGQERNGVERRGPDRQPAPEQDPLRRGVLEPSTLLYLQQAAGNRSVTRLLQRATDVGAAPVASPKAAPDATPTPAPADPVTTLADEIVAAGSPLAGTEGAAKALAMIDAHVNSPGSRSTETGKELDPVARLGDVLSTNEIVKQLTALNPKQRQALIQQVHSRLATMHGQDAETLAQQALPAFAVDPVPDLSVEIVAAAGPLAGTPQAGTMWTAITSQVLSANPAQKPAPANADKDPMAALQAVLYGSTVVSGLKLLTPDANSDRKKRDELRVRKHSVLDHIFQQLESVASQRTATEAEPSLGTIAHEYTLIQATSAKEYLKSVTAYAKARAGLLQAFGALEVGSRAALNRAAAYYDLMAPVGSFAGKKLEWPAKVHPHMAAAIRNAETRLHAVLAMKAQQDPIGAAAWFAALQDSFHNFGDGVEIRANANDQFAMSVHSWGWAIDLDADFNPNFQKGSPQGIVKAVTGQDIYKGRTGKGSGNFTTGKPYEEVQAEAERLREISQDYTAAFGSEDTLKQLMLSYVNRTLGTTWPSPFADNLLRAAQKADAGRDEQGLSMVEPLKELKEAAATGAVSKGTLIQKPASPQDFNDFAELLSVGQTLVWLARVYRESIDTPPAVGPPNRVAADFEGTQSTIAAHGFMNLDPDLVAALVSNGLAWLGSVGEGTKDFMHFELVKTPPLY